MTAATLRTWRFRATLGVLVFGVFAASLPLVAVCYLEGVSELTWELATNLLRYFSIFLLAYLVVMVAVRLSRPGDVFLTLLFSAPLLLWGVLIVGVSCAEIWRVTFLPRSIKRGFSTAMTLAAFTAPVQLLFGWLVFFVSLAFRFLTRPGRRGSEPPQIPPIEFTPPVAYARVPPPSSAPPVSRAALRASRVLFVVALLVGLLLFSISIR